MNRKRMLIVERDEAEEYLLISLVSFAATIILVRLFLQLTGYPQLGGSTLHIAHLLWGGLGLFVAVLLVLIYDNPLALRIAAVLTGVGIGLFIDEVGKFITQTNDYFFPAAAPIIYGFFLLTVVLYLLVRKPDARDSRRAMVKALEDLQEVIYSEFDTNDLILLRTRLERAAQSPEPYLNNLASALQAYVDQGYLPVQEYNPNLWQRTATTLAAWGRRQGRRHHKIVIVAGLIIVALSAVTVMAGLTWTLVVPSENVQSYVSRLIAEALSTDVTDINLYFVRLLLEAAVGVIAFGGIILLLRGDERRGLILAMGAVILSLTAIQLLTFYLDQFTAVLPTLYQFGLLVVILAYQRWYERPDEIESGVAAATMSETEA